MVNFGGIELFGTALPHQVFLLASEAEGGFGLNFNLLETNIINLAIIIGVLLYFGRGVIGKTLGDRRSAIETAIKEAEDRKKSAAASLAQEQQKLAQAQSEAARILADAEKSAEKARAAILSEMEEELVRMRQSASQDINTQQERIARELRERIAALAIAKAEERLQTGLNQDAQHQLLDQSIASLGGRA
ncbi:MULTISPECIES: F0F1 ATP synthase subunit B [unclassified Leptolyngbya]|uniref:F0F1 ATP synthase subunit B n=1 Tax=unclassified Leptolyngbya TaxID=2650499 RepID=UPI001F55590C|nr:MULTISPECIES: F0F1 ATP synthase subunit B [unclassified Leptolyngbya]